MTEKQQQLTFDKGITNVPSDALCSDNALEESLGMIYDDGEHRVIQKPVTLDGFENTNDILFVHTFHDEKRYIYATANGISWKRHGGEGISLLAISASPKVASIGKTLIVSDDEGMHYFLWREDDYKSLGILPEVDFECRLRSDRPASLNSPYMSWNFVKIDMKHELWNADQKIKDQETYNNLVAGAYAKNVKSIAQKKGFCQPFFVRTALEMYDGTYTRISQPILLLPCAYVNSVSIMYSNVLRIITMYARMIITQKQDFSEWSDIIKDIAIFISDGIDPYDTSVDQPLTKGTIEMTVDGVYCDTSLRRIIYQTRKYMSTYMGSCWGGDCLKKKEPKDFDSDIKGTSVFYKICSIGIKPVADKDLGDYINVHDLENITTKPILDHDDYFSHCKIYPKTLFAYNSRLNVANVERGLFEGYHNFMPFDSEESSVPVEKYYTFYVTLKLNNGELKTVCHENIKTSQRQGGYFFYPDSRAIHVTIIRKSTIDGPSGCICDEELTEHPNLNGAYFFRGFENMISGDTMTPEKAAVVVVPGYDNTYREELPNYIVTSEVNNPYVFQAEGYNNIGNGEIIGLSSTTQALSEGQFGQYPLLVFATDGIWAMSVGNTGLYQSIRPMSRDVALKDSPLAQTDGAVFFVSKKGLMVVSGGQVHHVSPQMSGKTLSPTFQIAELGDFQTFLSRCMIAYDYRDSLLWIANRGYNYCYVYSIKSGTFGKYSLGSYNNHTAFPIGVANDYPDSLICTTECVLSLLNRPNINDDSRDYGGAIISRPMKLENAFALKSIMRINHAHVLSDDASIELRIFASNNLKSWTELTSLRGTPWLFYRFRYDFSKMKATDRFSGALVITQERRTDKPRTYGSHNSSGYMYSITSQTYGSVWGNYIDIEQNEQQAQVLLDAQFWKQKGTGQAEPVSCHWAMWKKTMDNAYVLLYEGEGVDLSKSVTVNINDSSVLIGMNVDEAPTPLTAQAVLAFAVRDMNVPSTTYTYSISANTNTIVIPAGEPSIEAYVAGYSMRTANGQTEGFDCYMKMWKVSGVNHVVEAGNPQREGGGLGFIDTFTRYDSSVVIAISDSEISDTYVEGAYLATKVISIDSSSNPEPTPSPDPQPTPSDFKINLTIVSEVQSNSTGEIKIYVGGHNGIWANLPNADGSSNVYAFAAGSSHPFANVQCVGNGVNVEDFEGKPLDGSLVVYAFDGSNHNSEMVTASISGENGVFKNGGSYTITITNYNSTPSPAPTPTPSGNPVISINVNIQNNTGQAVTLDGDLYFVLGNPDHNGNYLGWQGSYNKTGHIYFSDTPVSFGVGETKSFFGISWYDSDTGCGLGEKSPIDPSELQAIGYHHNVAVYVGGNGEVVYCNNLSSSIIFTEGGTYTIVLSSVA